MAFVSLKDERQRAQNVTPYEPLLKAPEFYDVYSAAVGQVIDEELSISSYLNMGSFNERKDKVKVLAEDGLDIDLYTNQVGVIDYDRIARDTGKIESDESLFQQRNNMLAKRREYSQDVLDRGNGMAQFFGMATGFMLDPINVATLPIATAGVSLKSMGALGAAMTVAKREAALATASELGIQALVYQHKHDIDSPYSAKEALANIAIAATGAAALGFAAGGLIGYFGKVRKAAEDSGVIKPGSSEEMAYEQLARMEELIKAGRDSGEIQAANFKQIEEDFLAEITEELTTEAGGKISAGQVKNINYEINDLEYKLSQVVDAPVDIVTGKNISARQAKRAAAEAGAKLAGQDRKTLQDQIDVLYEQLAVNKSAAAAEANLTRVRQGIVPEPYQARLNKIKAEQEVNADIEYLADYETRMESYDPPSRAPVNYEQPRPQKAAPSTVTARERDILQRTGEVENYDADIQAYNNLDTRRVFINDELVDSDAVMKSIEDDIEGINSVLECAIG